MLLSQVASTGVTHWGHSEKAWKMFGRMASRLSSMSQLTGAPAFGASSIVVVGLSDSLYGGLGLQERVSQKARQNCVVSYII